jgi:hypothetical protein
MEEAERQLKCHMGFIVLEGALRRQTPERELEPQLLTDLE